MLACATCKTIVELACGHSLCTPIFGRGLVNLTSCLNMDFSIAGNSLTKKQKHEDQVIPCFSREVVSTLAAVNLFPPKGKMLDLESY